MFKWHNNYSNNNSNNTLQLISFPHNPYTMINRLALKTTVKENFYDCLFKIYDAVMVSDFKCGLISVWKYLTY